MNTRRKFLTGAGAVAVGVPTLSRVTTQAGPIEIRLFFTETQSERLDGAYDSFANQFREFITHALHETQVGQVDVTVTTHPDPIQLFERDIEDRQDLSGYTRRKKLLKWYSYHQQHDLPLADHSNVLIGTTDASVQGVATPSLGACCLDIDQFGFVWNPVENWESSQFLKDYVYRLLSHEVGHNLGLTHAHGCNSESGARSIMLKRGFAKHIGTNIFGQKILPAPHDMNIFNPRISRSHLTL